MFTTSVLITVHDARCQGLADARRHYERLLETHQDDGPLLPFTVLDALVGTFENVLAHLDARLDELETTVLGGRPLLPEHVQQVLAVTSEYGVGTITPSLTAVPDRDRLLGAKALTTGISLGTGLTASTSAFLVGQALLARRSVPHDTLRSPGSARAVLGGGLHATAAGLLGLSIGIHTRSFDGVVSTIFGVE